uniref:Uncharacterized protein n=1 Tax=Glossina palpalis gambiensis TaxID=67801 RepID=A0A1B0BEK3_9MUSC
MYSFMLIPLVVSNFDVDWNRPCFLDYNPSPLKYHHPPLLYYLQYVLANRRTAGVVLALVLLSNKLPEPNSSWKSSLLLIKWSIIVLLFSVLSYPRVSFESVKRIRNSGDGDGDGVILE